VSPNKKRKSATLPAGKIATKKAARTSQWVGAFFLVWFMQSVSLSLFGRFLQLRCICNHGGSSLGGILRFRMFRAIALHIQSTFSVSLSLFGWFPQSRCICNHGRFQSWRNSEVSYVSCNRVAYTIDVFCVSKSLEWSVSWWPAPSGV
jgi:hypothetical protein